MFDFCGNMVKGGAVQFCLLNSLTQKNSCIRPLIQMHTEKRITCPSRTFEIFWRQTDTTENITGLAEAMIWNGEKLNTSWAAEQQMFGKFSMTDTGYIYTCIIFNASTSMSKHGAYGGLYLCVRTWWAGLLSLRGSRRLQRGRGGQESKQRGRLLFSSCSWPHVWSQSHLGTK